MHWLRWLNQTKLIKTFQTKLCVWRHLVPTFNLHMYEGRRLNKQLWLRLLSEWQYYFTCIFQVQFFSKFLNIHIASTYKELFLSCTISYPSNPDEFVPSPTWPPLTTGVYMLDNVAQLAGSPLTVIAQGATLLKYLLCRSRPIKCKMGLRG